MASSSKGGKTTLKTYTVNIELQTAAVDNKAHQDSAKQKRQAPTPRKEEKNNAASSNKGASPSEQVQQFISYHHKQVECFGKSKLFESYNKKEKVKINIDREKIVFTGLNEKTVKKVRKEVKTQCDKIQNKSVAINSSVGSLLTKEDVVLYINKELGVDNVPVTWCVDSIVDQENLMVFALTEKDATKIAGNIVACVAENTISIQESGKSWFQDLLKNNSSKIVVSNSNNGMIVYCTKDVNERYFTEERKKLLASNNGTTAVVSVTNDLRQSFKGNSQASNAALQVSSKSQNTVASRLASGGNHDPSLAKSQSNSISTRTDINQVTKTPNPDYEGRAYRTEFVVVGDKKLKYMEEIYSKVIHDICKKHDITCDPSGGQFVLRGDAKSVEVSAKELNDMADIIEVFEGQSFSGKPVITEKIRQEWTKIEKDKKCLILVGRCRKPVVTSGWIMKAETQKLNILSVDGQIHLLDADVILCPVSDTLEPVGTADLFQAGLVQNESIKLLGSKPKKQFKVGNLVPVYDPVNMNCRCLLLVVQDTTAGATKDSKVETVADDIVNFIETHGYRSLGLLVADTSFFFPLLHHLWNRRANFKRPVHAYCIVSEQNFGTFDSFVHERLKIENYQDSVTMECLPLQESNVSAIQIQVEQGSILDFDGKVDVIINSVGSDLDLQRGTVSKQLVQRAGKTIQDQCDKIGGIDIGGVAITTAGNLRCKQIFHVALYIFWESLGDLSIKVLKSIMIRCLKETEKLGLSSIAFPALGTGLLGYPPCLVAKVMFDAVEEFGKTKATYLKNVYFVLFEEETVEVFRNVDFWRKKSRTEINMVYDALPRSLLYTARDLETRVMVLDRDYYKKLSYRELRIVFSDQTSQAMKLDWDFKDGCYATRMNTPQTEVILKKSFQDIIQLMHERKFHVADIIVSNPGLSLMEHVSSLILELIVHGDKIDRVNYDNRKKKVLPTINYIKLVRMFVKSEDYDGVVDDCMGENMKKDRRGVWHVTEETAYPFDIHIVGEKKNAKDVFKQVQNDISSIEATFKIKMNIKKSEMAKAKKKLDKLKKDMEIILDEDSHVVTGEGTKTQISNAKKELEQFQDNDICFDMTEDDIVTLMYITTNEHWRSHVEKWHFEKGKAVFELDKTANITTISYLIRSKNNLLHQLSGAEVSPPHQFQDQFPMIQQQVEDMGTDIYCFLSLDKKRIIIKSGSYEQAQSAKYMIEVNLGMVPQGGGRRNRVIASSDMGPGPVANKTSAEESAVRDGKRFRTKEGIDIYVYCAGIGNLKVETLVNAANKDLQHGGGIAYHINNAAGYALEKECDDYIRNNGPIPVGSCCTSTAGKLPYNFIIHAVGPMWHSYKHDRKGECLDDLKSTILSALKMATEKGLKSIALPSISSGIFGVPKELCAQQYLEAVKTYSNNYQTSAITEIHFIDKDRAMCNLIQKTFEKELGSGQKM